MKPTYFGVNKYLQIYQSHFQRIKKKKKKVPTPVHKYITMATGVTSRNRLSHHSIGNRF